MLKNMLFMSVRPEIGEMYLVELHKIFDGFLNITFFCMENKSNEVFSQQLLENIDLVLITDSNIYTVLRNSGDRHIPIIHLDFTFTKENIELLKTYPENTNAYVGFFTEYLSQIVISLLYNFGVQNLNLHVYDKNNKNKIDPSAMQLGIVGESSNAFPVAMSPLVSLGKRKVALNTIMDVVATMSLMSEVLRKRIDSYQEQIAVFNNGLSYFYGQSASTQIQLRTIVDCIDSGFLMYDQNRTILDCNNQLLQLFGIQKSILGMRLEVVSELCNIRQEIIDNNLVEDKLIFIPSLQKHVLLSSKVIESNINKKYTIVILNDVTKIMNLESTLRKELAKKGHVAKYKFEYILGVSTVIKKCITKAKKIAKIDKPTLLIGESGTGKELFAQSIHNESDRCKFAFVAINCAAIHTSLLESELFGYEDGSFTGAKKGGKVGLFEAAHKGTIFLDEIGEISLETQAKLLRVLEQHEIMRVGSNEITSVDVRVIAATNRNLQELVKQEKFRLDLFFRLNTIMLQLPSLRERQEDIIPLAYEFLRNESMAVKKIDPAVLEFLKRYRWDGNIRELRNCMEYMAHISEEIIDIYDFPDYMLSEIYMEKQDPISSIEKEATSKILKLLEEKPMGRRKIIEELKKQGIKMSEYKLRQLLEELYQKGYIIFGKGSAGATITVEGKLLVNNVLG